VRRPAVLDSSAVHCALLLLLLCPFFLLLLLLLLLLLSLRAAPAPIFAAAAAAAAAVPIFAAAASPPAAVVTARCCCCPRCCRRCSHFVLTLLSLCAAENRQLSGTDKKIKPAEIKLPSAKSAIHDVGTDKKIKPAEIKLRSAKSAIHDVGIQKKSFKTSSRKIKLQSAKNAIHNVGIQKKSFKTSSRNSLLGTSVCEYFAEADPRKIPKKKVSSRSSIASGYILCSKGILIRCHVSCRKGRRQRRRLCGGSTLELSPRSWSAPMVFTIVSSMTMITPSS
jgi:hypothetical protein